MVRNKEVPPPLLIIIMISFILASMVTVADANQNFSPPTTDPAVHMCLDVERDSFDAANRGVITRDQAWDLSRRCWDMWA